MLYIVMILLCAVNLQAGPGQSHMYDESDQFFAAIEQGNFAQVVQYLNDHANDIPQGALHKAIKNNQKEILKLLIERGADVDQRYDNACPVHLAVNRPELLELLLVNGASVDTITKSGKVIVRGGQTALHIACEIGQDNAYNLLVEYGASLVVRDQKGYVPLHYAVVNERTAIVKQLIAIPGCPINVPQANGMTPIMMGVRWSNFGVVDHLIAGGADLNLQDNKGNTALHYAMGSLLRYADPEIVALLLKRGANACIFNKKKDVALHVAAKRACDTQAALLIPQLISCSDINQVNTKGETPLVKAINHGKYNTASLLLGAGADPNLGTPAPLLKVVNRGCDNGGSELMQKLIQKGADLTVTDENGKTLQQIACCDATRALLRNGN